LDKIIQNCFFNIDVRGREVDGRGIFRGQTALFDAAKARLAGSPVNSPPFRRLKQYGAERPPVFAWAAFAKRAVMSTPEPPPIHLQGTVSFS